jgi:hypothetical protein
VQYITVQHFQRFSLYITVECCIMGGLVCAVQYIAALSEV